MEETLAKILKSSREKAGVSLVKMSVLTGIHSRHLASLETGEYTFLPPDVYVVGIIKKYAKNFDLDEKELIDIFLQEKPKKEININQSNNKNSYTGHGKSFSWRLLIFGLIFGSILYFIFFEISKMVLPPEIILNNLNQDLSVNSSVFKLEGEVARTKRLIINGLETYFDKDGKFIYDINLNEGTNNIILEAFNQNANKKTILERKIIYQNLESEPVKNELDVSTTSSTL